MEFVYYFVWIFWVLPAKMLSRWQHCCNYRQRTAQCSLSWSKKHFGDSCNWTWKKYTTLANSIDHQKINSAYKNWTSPFRKFCAMSMVGGTRYELMVFVARLTVFASLGFLMTKWLLKATDPTSKTKKIAKKKVPKCFHQPSSDYLRDPRCRTNLTSLLFSSANSAIFVWILVIVGFFWLDRMFFDRLRIRLERWCRLISMTGRSTRVNLLITRWSLVPIWLIPLISKCPGKILLAWKVLFRTLKKLSSFPFKEKNCLKILCWLKHLRYILKSFFLCCPHCLFCFSCQVFFCNNH